MRKKINNNKSKNKIFADFFFNYLLKLFFFFSYFSISKGHFRIIFSKYSEVNLVIKGTGFQNILGDGFNKYPTDVLVNGISQKDTCQKTCELSNDYNNITIIFNEDIDSCEFMFKNCKNTIEIDLSKFDFSKVKTMNSMFDGCTSLDKINFGNINTSSVKNMDCLFQDCRNLNSIDVSKFDTSNVESMRRMFGYCMSLTSIDCSNFNTSKVKDMFDMFGYCYSLITVNVSSFVTSQCANFHGMFYWGYNLKYLDLSNFDFSSVTEDDNVSLMFSGCTELIYLNLCSCKISRNMHIYPYLKYYIKGFEGLNISNCNNICNDKEIKIDMQKNECVAKCDEDKFQYKNLCYKICPIGYPAIINNKKICLDEIPKNFSFYSEDNTYKECFYLCKEKIKLVNGINIKCDQFINDIIHMKITSNNNYNNCFEKCQFYYYINDSYFYRCTNNNSCPDNFKNLIIDKKKCVSNCNLDDIYIYEYNNICYKECPEYTINNKTNNICYLDYNLYKKDKKIEDFEEKIKKGDLDNIIKDLIENKKDHIEKENDTIFEITTTENQKNNSNNNISTIDLGNCEKELRDFYKINEKVPLIIFKIDYYPSDTLIPIIGYEIYHPIEKYKLNLSYCNSTQIKLNVPVTIDENKLYKYNPNSDFYTDNCFAYTTENGTDIILNDRKQEFIDNKLSLCENNCEYVDYDKDTKKSSCQCIIKNKIELISEIINNPNKLSNNFSSGESDSSNANLATIKCTKQLFSKDGLIKNISSYILLFFIFFFLLSIILFIKCGYPLLEQEMKEIIQIISKTKNKSKISYTRKKSIIKKGIKRKIINYPPKNNLRKAKSIQINNSSQLRINKGKKRPTNFIMNNYNINFQNTNINSNKKKRIKISPKIKKDKNKNNKNEFNIFEINTFSYKKAILYDKRTCWEYYISLLKIKHPLLFTFFPFKDYNSMIIKLCIFCISFSIYYATNFAFFDENVLHLIYEHQGKYNILYFLPKISISFAISYIANIIIKYIFLSERNLLEIKNQTNVSSADSIMQKEKRNLCIKYTIFFILGIIFLSFFWMILSSFGAVYQNAQIIVFENTLISFTMSLFYPFFFNILPCIFRISALSSKTKKEECAYQFSKFLQLL